MYLVAERRETDGRPWDSGKSAVRTVSEDHDNGLASRACTFIWHSAGETRLIGKVGKALESGYELGSRHKRLVGSIDANGTVAAGWDGRVASDDVVRERVVCAARAAAASRHRQSLHTDGRNVERECTIRSAASPSTT